MLLTKGKNLLLLACLTLCLAAACEEEGPAPGPVEPNNSLNKIMPLGASRVAGDRPAYESYRYELWKLLVDAEAEFDFVGTERDNAAYPSYNNLDFDPDHEGRGGITSSGILEELNIWLSDLGTAPDIVLFSSPGGNDGIDNYPQTLTNINAILDVLQAANPNMTIFIELPAPPLTNEQTAEFLEYYNRALMDIPVIASQKSTATSPVVVVDMKTGFIDDYLADDVHYSEAGGRFIAERYFAAIDAFLE
ncbi:MAG: hypothetical protein AAFN92_02845 [Bacteroidota bacterium]